MNLILGQPLIPAVQNAPVLVSHHHMTTEVIGQGTHHDRDMATSHQVIYLVVSLFNASVFFFIVFEYFAHNVTK